MNDWQKLFERSDSFFSMLLLLGPTFYPYYARLIELGFTHQQASELAVECKAEASKKSSYQEGI